MDRWLQDRPVLDYVASRFSPRLFVPLSLLLCIASRSLASVPASVFAINLLLALAMLFQFRLWDDLSDREVDLSNHPDRVLCRVQSTVPFIVLVMVMGGINLAAIASLFPARSLLVFLALNALIAAWYGWLRRLSANSIVRSHVVLLKYPAFVLVMTPEAISGCSSISVSAVLGLVYLCLCCYELLHDPRQRAVHRSQSVLAIELLMMAAAGVAAQLPGSFLVTERRPVGDVAAVAELAGVQTRSPATSATSNLIPGGRPSAVATLSGPSAQCMEHVACYYCGQDSSEEFVWAEEDLTGKPGRFRFVRCCECGLVYQNPRIDLEHIKDYYDDEYIAHRKRRHWGISTPFYNWAMDKHDRQKDTIVRQYVALNGDSEVLDVGCGAGTFLLQMRRRYAARVTGVDFKDLSHLPGLDEIDFRQGLFYEQGFADRRFDLITMWHFLEHDYDPRRTLRPARDALKDDGRLVIEVPRLDSVTYRLFHQRWPGLQAPQHTVLYTKETLLNFMIQSAMARNW